MGRPWGLYNKLRALEIPHVISRHLTSPHHTSPHLPTALRPAEEGAAVRAAAADPTTAAAAQTLAATLGARVLNTPATLSRTQRKRTLRCRIGQESAHRPGKTSEKIVAPGTSWAVPESLRTGPDGACAHPSRSCQTQLAEHTDLTTKWTR